LPHTAARLFHRELRQASASLATASNFDEPDRSGIRDPLGRSPPQLAADDYLASGINP
jgi:hypothetical protein